MHVSSLILEMSSMRFVLFKLFCFLQDQGVFEKVMVLNSVYEGNFVFAFFYNNSMLKMHSSTALYC